MLIVTNDFYRSREWQTGVIEIKMKSGNINYTKRL